MNTPDPLENRCDLGEMARRTGRGGPRVMLLALTFWFGATLSPCSTGHAETSEKDRYVQSVITMIRMHSEAIRQLATHDFKYSRNLARHATALHNTFGLLGPMERHAGDAALLQKKGRGGTALREEDFDKMADQCQKSMKRLYHSSIQHMEKADGADRVLKALDDLQGRCTACHDLLEGVAPEVWGASRSVR
ncbi:MAG: hypothetical protein HQM02_05285 [Magnetococcales bacterium]|nr:hypothetical protein [Magnetococcales bacterium]